MHTIKAKQKQGVSALIATAVLVGFAVVVTGVVMMFGGDIVQDTIEKQGGKADLSLDCSRTSFSVRESTPGKIEILNDGQVDIHAFFIRYMGSDAESVNSHYVMSVKQGEIGEFFTSPPGGGVGTPEKVKIFAKNNAGPKGKPIFQVCANTETTIRV